MPDPLLGFSLQSLAPLAQPHTVSSAVALVSLCCRVLAPELRSSRREGRSPAPTRSAPHMETTSQQPSPSGLCSMRESATSHRRFRSVRARSSLGLVALQGFLPRVNRLVLCSTLHDPRGLHRSCERIRPTAVPSGCSFPRGWLVSLETASLPGLSRLMTLHTRSRRSRFGSHLLEPRGALPSPDMLSLNR
jgi:hypothetical protein